MNMKMNGFNSRITGITQQNWVNISTISNSAAIEGRSEGYFVWYVNDETHEITGTTFDPNRDVKNEPLKHSLARQLSPVSGSIKFRYSDDIEIALINTEDSEDVYTVINNKSIKLNKDSWYNVLVYKENSIDEDIEVNIQVSGVELRIEDRVSILDYKTDYIGDNVNVNVIVKLLPYPSGYVKDYIEIKTSVKPYELIVHLKGEGSKEEKDFAECANLAFELIGNMDVFMVILEDNTLHTFKDDIVG